MARLDRRCPSTFATTVLAVAIWGLAGAFTSARAGAVASETTPHRARGAHGSGPRGTAQRAADRLLARRVRGVIRADPSLALAAPALRVTSNRGIVRLVGWVHTDKERSSIAFKAGQIARAGGIDDRVTVGNGVEASAPQRGVIP